MYLYKTISQLMKKMEFKIKNFLKFYIEFLVKRCFIIFAPRPLFSFFLVKESNLSYVTST